MSQPSTRPPLVFQCRLNAAQDAVFSTFFHAPDRWLCRGGSFEPRPGGKLRLCWPDGCVEGQLMQFVPPQTGRDVLIRLESSTWAGPRDPRALGVQLDSVRLEQAP